MRPDIKQMNNNKKCPQNSSSNNRSLWYFLDNHCFPDTTLISFKSRIWILRRRCNSPFPPGDVIRWKDSHGLHKQGNVKEESCPLCLQPPPCWRPGCPPRFLIQEFKMKLLSGRYCRVCQPRHVHLGGFLKALQSKLCCCSSLERF